LEQTPTSKLLDILAAEHAALLEFVSLLEREQEMLVNDPGDQLLALSEQKTADALTLNGFAQERRAIFQKNIAKLDIDSIRAWLGAHSPEGLSLWQNILALAKRSQQLNLDNGKLIQMKLRHNQQSLAVLSDAAKKANLYGPDGQPDIPSSSGRSLGNG